MRLACGWVCVALALGGGCGRIDYDLLPGQEDASAADAGMDGDVHVVGDAATDGAVDSGTTGTDAGTDGGLDAGMDASIDGGMDAGSDAGTDAGFDAGSGTLAPLADTYIRPFDPSVHGSDPEMASGRAASGSLMYPLVRFDVSAHAGTTITRATLRLYQYDHSGTATMTIRVHRVLQGWEEAAADWDMATSTTAWSSGGGGNYDATVVASTSVPLGSHGWYEWDITSLVQDWIDGTAANHGVQITWSGSISNGVSARFASREHATTSWTPQLVITP